MLRGKNKTLRIFIIKLDNKNTIKLKIYPPFSNEKAKNLPKNNVLKPLGPSPWIFNPFASMGKITKIITYDETKFMLNFEFEFYKIVTFVVIASFYILVFPQVHLCFERSQFIAQLPKQFSPCFARKMINYWKNSSLIASCLEFLQFWILSSFLHQTC